MKEFVKKVLKSCALGKLIYEPLHQLYRLYSVPHRRKLLHKHGTAVLAELAKQFKNHDIPGYATYGTLLGFVRDHGFIPHDDDVDVAVMPSETWNATKVLKTLLDEPGFSYAFGFTYDDKLVGFKLVFKQVPIDFYFPEVCGPDFRVHEFYYCPNIKYPSEKCNSTRLLNEPRVKGIVTISVFGVDFPIPSNSNEVLQGMYGENWRIPDANWSESSVPNVTVLPNYGMSVSEEEAICCHG